MKTKRRFDPRGLFVPYTFLAVVWTLLYPMYTIIDCITCEFLSYYILFLPWAPHVIIVIIGMYNEIFPVVENKPKRRKK